MLLNKISENHSLYLPQRKASNANTFWEVTYHLGEVCKPQICIILRLSCGLTRHVLGHSTRLTNNSSCRWCLLIYHLHLIYSHSMRFNLEAERLCTFLTWFFMELIQLLLWPSLNFEHTKPKEWRFQHAIIVSVKFQEGNKPLLIIWTECVPMA